MTQQVGKVAMIRKMAEAWDDTSPTMTLADLNEIRTLADELTEAWTAAGCAVTIDGLWLFTSGMAVAKTATGAPSPTKGDAAACLIAHRLLTGQVAP